MNASAEYTHEALIVECPACHFRNTFPPSMRKLLAFTCQKCAEGVVVNHPDRRD